MNNFPLMQRLGSGVITTTRDVDCVEFDWGKIHFLSEPVVTNAERFSFGIVELAQGKGHARHNHPGSEEIIYVVSGEGEQMVDDKPPVKVGPGASIYIPADIYHSTVNTGSETMKLIVVYSPAGPERLLREIPGAKVITASWFLFLLCPKRSVFSAPSTPKAKITRFCAKRFSSWATTFSR